MNQTDRDRLARLYVCMSNFPWPNRNKTLGVDDVMNFYRSMEELQPLFRNVIMSIARCDSPHEDPDCDLDELTAALERMNKGSE